MSTSTISISQLIAKFPGVFTIKDVADILIVAGLSYLAIMLLKRTHSYFMAGGIVMLGVLYSVALYFNLYLTSLIFQYFFAFLIVILAVVFQKELRNFFEWIFVLGVFAHQKPKPLSVTTSKEIADALRYLADKKIGALIVVSGHQPLDRLVEGGYQLNGRISRPLILSIFDPSSPGHDGAVVIEGDKIKRFATHLPLAEKFNQIKDLGTRHRSGLGLSERSDALVMIVSEERGTISLARKGILTVIHDADELEKEIREFLAEWDESTGPWHRWFTQNKMEKALSLGVACVLWAVFVFQFGEVSRDFSMPIEFRYLPSEYLVDDIEPDTVDVTVSARNQTLRNYESRSPHVTIDLDENIREGWQRVHISSDNIDKAASLTVTNIEPASVRFHIRRAK